jgi:carbonic anhydrase/acetyltransferase-like protein (isoleucine patch superfamily)
MAMRGLRRLARVNLPATVRHRRQGVTVYRSTTVRIDGSKQIRGQLQLGAQWAGSPFFSPGHLLVVDGGLLEVTGDFRIFTGLRVVVDKGAVLSLGSGYINHDVRISCFSSITIGDDVAISEEVTIRDSDNHEVVGRQSPSTAPIVIGDHVWIGLRSTILKGVTIGSGSIVAAGSVVTKDVAPNTLVAGVPALPRRSDVHWT